MSHDENHEMEDEVETKSKERKVAKHDSGAADLERVTNYAEEKEIKSDASFISVINDVKRQDDANKVNIYPLNAFNCTESDFAVCFDI